MHLHAYRYVLLNLPVTLSSCLCQMKRAIAHAHLHTQNLLGVVSITRLDYILNN